MDQCGNHTDPFFHSVLFKRFLHAMNIPADTIIFQIKSGPPRSVVAIYPNSPAKLDSTTSPATIPGSTVSTIMEI